MKAREYKHLEEHTPTVASNLLIRLFCKHHFVIHRLDELLFPKQKNMLYVTCNKCGKQYICEDFFENDHSITIKPSYLVKFVDPNKEYPVSYTIKQNGERINEPSILKGSDLTEPQIFELFKKELL